jgi:hypothetical protein
LTRATADRLVVELFLIEPVNESVGGRLHGLPTNGRVDVVVEIFGVRGTSLFRETCRISLHRTDQITPLGVEKL